MRNDILLLNMRFLLRKSYWLETCLSAYWDPPNKLSSSTASPPMRDGPNLPKLRVLNGPLKEFLNKAWQAKKAISWGDNLFSCKIMPLSEKFSELAAYISSPEYLLTARHPDHPTAFTRDRKLHDLAWENISDSGNSFLACQALFKNSFKGPIKTLNLGRLVVWGAGVKNSRLPD